MSRAINQLVAAIAVVGFAGISGCIGRTPPSGSVARGPSQVDTVAAQLAELELERIAVRAATTVEIASTRDIDARIAALHERLRGLRTDGNSERTAAERLLLALDARDSSVTMRIQQARMVYTDQYPPVRQALTEHQLLKQRRSWG
jgi:outer membrane murein-binding lipoprotein Lpp